MVLSAFFAYFLPLLAKNMSPNASQKNPQIYSSISPASSIFCRLIIIPSFAWYHVSPPWKYTAYGGRIGPSAESSMELPLVKSAGVLLILLPLLILAALTEAYVTPLAAGLFL